MENNGRRINKLRKAIVTGANGFVGTQLTAALSARGYAVCAVVSPSSQTALPDIPNITVVRCDMSRYRDLPDLAGAFSGADAFFHLAWNGSAGALRADYVKQLNNVRYACDAVCAAQALCCGRFVGAGTMKEEESTAAAFSGNGTLLPAFHYSAAKLCAHIMAQTEAERLRIPFCWGKISNAYGETDHTGNFINALLKKLLNNEECRLTTGEQMYDFIYVQELARAFVDIGERGTPGRAYYIGSGEAQPLRSFIETAHKIAKSDSALLFGAVPFDGPKQEASFFDATALSQDTGFFCRVPFAEGIAKTIAAMRQEMH